MKRFLRLLRRRPIVVQHYRVRKITEQKQKMQDLTNQLARECGRPDVYVNGRFAARGSV